MDPSFSLIRGCWRRQGERELHQARIQRILDTEASRMEEEVSSIP